MAPDLTPEQRATYADLVRRYLTDEPRRDVWAACLSLNLDRDGFCPPRAQMAPNLTLNRVDVVWHHASATVEFDGTVVLH